MCLKRFAFLVAILLCLSTACSRTKKPEIVPAATPNILLITVDTLRADRLGCYGYQPARTPNIDRLATEGVRVEDAIAPTPLTLPSHTSILTGLQPPAHGVRDNGTYRVPDAAETLAEYLKIEGYQTQAFVSAEVLHHRFNLNQGFDGYDDALWDQAAPADYTFRERSGEQTMNRVLNWLAARSTQSAGAPPFFAWVHLFDPHEPHSPPEADVKLSPTLYDGEIASVDRQIGRLVEALKNKNVLDDTILVFTSDHGESLGEHEEGTHSIFIYEATVRVPLIFRYPSKLAAGEVYRGSVQSVDIMPTLLGIADKKPTETQGKDLSKALVGPPLVPSLPQYSESLHPKLAFGMAPLQGVRLDEWTYIRAPRAELYNRKADPRELRNLLELDDSGDAAARAIELDALVTKVVQGSERFGLVAEVRPLDPETVEMLQALGYMGNSDAPEDLEGMDPKDGVRIFDKMDKAVASMQAGDCAKAAKELASVLKQLPGHVGALNTLAKCEARMGNQEAAREHYLKSLAREPQQPEVFLQLGRIDFEQGRHAEARRHFSEALELFPDLVDAMMLMGYLEFTVDQPAKGLRWFDRAIAADPNRPDVYSLQGDLYFRKRKFNEARGWYEKALAVSPGSYSASMQAALCSLQLGDLSTAERYMLRAAEADPTQWQPLYNLGCIRAQQGDSNAALSHLEDAATKGFTNLAQLQNDPCMASLSSEPRFMELMRALRGAEPR